MEVVEISAVPRRIERVRRGRLTFRVWFSGTTFAGAGGPCCIVNIQNACRNNQYIRRCIYQKQYKGFLFISEVSYRWRKLCNVSRRHQLFISFTISYKHFIVFLFPEDGQHFPAIPG